jgi:ketosteroid isomerase-like protein
MANTPSTASHEILATAHAWDRAMVTNDAGAIGRYMADDWIIVGSDGSMAGKGRFLGLVEAGTLTHNEMTSDDVEVRVYGDAAVVTSRGVSGGTYQGHPFREVERVSCVFVRKEGRWLCVLTHLSKLPGG